MIVKLRMTGAQHAELRNHLLGPDGNESVACALCGRRAGEAIHALCVHKIVLVPNDECLVRTPSRVTWRTESIRRALAEAARRNWAVVKFHSHPQGFSDFSSTDDAADRELFAAVHSWVDSDLPHASVVMLPDGKMFGRWIASSGASYPINVIAVAGDDLHFWFPHGADQNDAPRFAERARQAFGSGTIALLRRLSVAIVGCSGTGSPVIELLVRHGIGRLVLVDPDRIEERNIDRIIFACMSDVGRLKVDVAVEWIARVGVGTEVECIPTNLYDPLAVRRVAECDILIGCMDGSEGRYLRNRVSSFYSLPYIDVGVRLEADGQGGISQICGTVHYLKPGGSSLLSRRAITMEAIQAEGLRRTNPQAYSDQVRSKYISGVREDRPAVAAVNMHYASLAVLELLARVHSYRVEGNCPFAQFGSSLTDPRFEPMEPDGPPCPFQAKHVGRGDTVPLLENPFLSEIHAA